MCLHRIPPAALAVVLALALLAGCGAAPEPVGPSGVDGLQIPTPSADPADFVAQVSNPWLAWSAGSRRVYAGTDAQGRQATYTVAVRPETVPVAGIETTAVDVSLVRDRTGKVEREGTTYAAQDREGNVWLLGQDGAEGNWRAGEDGARAGLLMPATPRVGDGFVVAQVPGRATDRYRVLDVMATPPAEAAGTGTALLMSRAAADETGEAEEYYRRGVGLVASRHDEADGSDLTLIEWAEPSA